MDFSRACLSGDNIIEIRDDFQPYIRPRPSREYLDEFLMLVGAKCHEHFLCPMFGNDGLQIVGGAEPAQDLRWPCRAPARGYRNIGRPIGAYAIGADIADNIIPQLRVMRHALRQFSDFRRFSNDDRRSSPYSRNKKAALSEADTETNRHAECCR